MLKLQWETRQAKVKDLISLEINPRKISKEKQAKLIQSLEKFNLVEIPAVNYDWKIIGGNQRVMALILAGRGEDTIDVRYPNRQLTPAEMKEYVIISNTHAGEFDLNILLAEFADVDLKGMGFDLAGIDMEDLYKEEKKIEEDNFEHKGAATKTDIKPGDLIEIGPHKLLCGDSTKKEEWQKLMGKELCDMVMTDPPYNVNYEGGTGLKIMNDQMGDKMFYKFLFDFYTALGAFTKKGGAWYVWHADSEGANFRQAMKDAGLLVKQCLIWVKNSLVMGRQDYHWKHEPCLYGWKEGAAHYFVDERMHTTVIEDKIDIKKMKPDEMRKMLTEILSEKTSTTVIHCDKPHSNDVHPTMKPILLLAPLIRNSSKVNEIVADGFGGAGSTMVASHQLNRRCRMIELDPKYCQVIVDRMMTLDTTLKVKINGNEYRV